MFDLDIIKNVYKSMDAKIEKARSLLQRPMTLTEKILYSHLNLKVEQSFDQIADGSENWTSMIKGFYDGFHKMVDFVKENSEMDQSLKTLIAKH